MLSPFSAANRDSDARAFAALLKHLRETDGTRHTVVMVQVENEIGMIPTARDRSAASDRAFASAVPLPHLFEVWRAAAPSIDFLSPDIYFQARATAKPR